MIGWLRRWWLLLAFAAVVVALALGTVLTIDSASPNTDRPIYFVTPTPMTDQLRNRTP